MLSSGSNGGGPSPALASSSSTRPAFSCLPCRSRKVRCDRRRHCGNCSRRGEECVWPALSVPLAEERDKENDASLQDRIERLERIIRNAGLDREEVDSLLQPHDLDLHDEQGKVAIDDLLEPSDVTQHDGFDHQIISTRKRRRIEALSPEAPVQRHEVRQLETILPVRSRCDALIRIYFDRVEWIHHVLHRPSFQSWYRSYWENGLTRSIADLHLIALLFSMLCLALHFDDQRDTADEDGERRYFEASHKALQLGDYLSRHTTAGIQTLIMQGLWLNNKGYSERHHANLALAVRFANTLGLSCIDASQGSKQAHDWASESFLETEMRRRIYWSLVCQDCYTASSCNFTYLIHSSQIKTHHFLNASDDELIEVDQKIDTEERDNLIHMLSRRKLAGQPTTSSYHLAKIPFALTAKKFVDLCNADDNDYRSILALETETRECYQRLPRYLQQTEHPSASRQMQWQQLFMGITLHNRIIRLHRPFLTRAYTDIEYSHSVTVTMSSAKALLELVEHGKKIAFPGLRWWVVLVHIFTAGVALCIDLHYHLLAQSISLPSPARQQEEEDRRGWVQMAIAQLSDVRLFSQAADRAVEILQTLYEQVECRGQFTPSFQQSPPELPSREAPDWSLLFEQALNGASNYTTDQAILETINTFAQSWQP